jgi:hypothetical protein
VVALGVAVAMLNSTRVFPGLWAVLPVIGTGLLILAGPDTAMNRALSTRVLVWIGLISYPLYLWHWPLIVFSRIAAGGTPPVELRVLVVVASILLAAATYRVVELPLRFGPRRRFAVPGLCAVLLLVAAAGMGTHAAAGFEERGVIRSDAGNFVEYYERMRKTGIANAYRSECDFMEWGTAVNRATVNADCTAAGTRRTFFLWGDSFAQALSLGLRENLPPGTALAQVATSSCRAQVDDFDTSVEDNRCEIADRYAMRVIGDLHPEVVILAQNAEHLETDWAGVTGKILELGAGQVIVVGPSPMWAPTLPRVYATHHMQDHADYVSTGLYLDAFEIDKKLAALLAPLPHVRVVSLLDHLCRGNACLARVPGEGPIDLMSIDYGHLSPKGSSYLGRTIWKPLLESLTR